MEDTTTIYNAQSCNFIINHHGVVWRHDAWHKGG